MNIMIRKGVLFTLVAVLLFASVGCVKTEYTESDNIIEASELGQLLSKDNVIVIDARSEEDYLKGHLEGAIHLTTSELSVSEPVPGLIAPKEQVETVLGQKGIQPESKVYIYDNKNGIYAGRIWWVMKVYGHEHVKVINGGDTAIVKEGLALTQDIPEVTPTQYVVQNVNTSLNATIEQVLEVVEGVDDGKLLDVRSVSEHAEGTIPTSILYPHTKNVYVDGTFKSPRDIYNDYSDLGLKRDDKIIVYCKSSVRAAQTALLLEEAGFENVLVYDGAWLEWSTKDVPKEESTEVVTPSAADGS